MLAPAFLLLWPSCPSRSWAPAGSSAALVIAALFASNIRQAGRPRPFTAAPDPHRAPRAGPHLDRGQRHALLRAGQPNGLHRRCAHRRVQPVAGAAAHRDGPGRRRANGRHADGASRGAAASWSSGACSRTRGPTSARAEFDIDTKLLVSLRQWDNMDRRGVPGFETDDITYLPDLPDEAFRVDLPRRRAIPAETRRGRPNRCSALLAQPDAGSARRAVRVQAGPTSSLPSFASPSSQ